MGNNSNDTTKFDDYQRHLLRKRSLGELVKLERKENPFCADALLTAFVVFPRKTASTLRAVLKDGFESRFEKRLREIEGRSSLGGSEFAKGARDVKGFCCLRQTQAALNILVLQMKVEDLTVARGNY